MSLEEIREIDLQENIRGEKNKFIQLFWKLLRKILIMFFVKLEVYLRVFRYFFLNVVIRLNLCV